MTRELGNLFPELEKDLKPYTASFTTGILPYQDIVKLIAGGRINAGLPVEDATGGRKPPLANGRRERSVVPNRTANPKRKHDFGYG